MSDHKASDQRSSASSQGPSRQVPPAATAPVPSAMGSLPTMVSTALGFTSGGGTRLSTSGSSSSSVVTPTTSTNLIATPSGLVPSVPAPASLPLRSSLTNPPILDPVPQSVRTPASLTDVARRECLKQGTDGLVRVIPVASFTAGDGVSLDAISGQDSSRELLLPASQRGLPVPDLTNPLVRIQCDRETLPLLRCFGLEGFSAQVLGSLQLLRVLLDLAQTLQAGLSDSGLPATNAQLSSKVNELVSTMLKQKEHFQGQTSGLEQQLHSKPAGVVSSSDQTGIGAQKLRVLGLENRLKALGSQYDDAVAEGQRFRDQVQSQGLRIAEVETQLDKAGHFSPTGLLDFIMTNGKVEEFWPRLRELLEHYWASSDMPTGTRTLIHVQARDRDDDSCGDYTPLSTHPVVHVVILMSSGQAAQTLSTLAQVASTSASPTRSSSGKQKGFLGSSRGPRGPGSQLRVTQSPPAKLSALRQVSSSSSKAFSKRIAASPGSDQAPLDLTSSEPSPPTTRTLKSYLDRSLLQGRPRIHTPVSSGPRTKSPSKVTDIDAARSIPNQFSWDGTRADVRERMLGGLSFWDAVAEAGKTQALHHRFALKALVYMLMSAIYCEALDSTPWIRYLPVNFLETALGRVKDVQLARMPERWKPLPVQPSSGNDGQAGFQDYNPSDFAESDSGDDDDDVTYQDRAPKGKSSVMTRSRQPSVGDKRLRQTVYGKGLGSKKGKRDFQFPDEIKDLPGKFKLPAMTASDTYAETPSNRSSWRHYGVLVQPYQYQTLGFPAYTPARTDNKLVHARWDTFSYLALIATEPWNDMWANCVGCLIFFRYSNLEKEMITGLVWIINFMWVWRREYWERGHWVTITSSFYFFKDPRFLALSTAQKLKIINLYMDRKTRSSAFFKAKAELMKALQELDGYGDEVWFEAGLWVIPENPCD